MNNIEQLKQIIENAPEGATHVEDNGIAIRLSDYLKLDENDNWSFFSDKLGWVLVGDSQLNDYYSMRSLSDIKTIVEQAEEIERLQMQLKYMKKLAETKA